MEAALQTYIYSSNIKSHLTSSTKKKGLLTQQNIRRVSNKFIKQGKQGTGRRAPKTMDRTSGHF